MPGVHKSASATAESSSASEAAPHGTLRWIFDVSKWNPSKAEWEFLLGLIPKVDSDKVMRYVQEIDRRRALISRLLQRRACFEVTGVPWDKVRIERTKGSKPFMANKPRPGSAGSAGMCVPPNWNYNISHEGLYVVLAAEPHCVCGVDVTEPWELRNRSINGALRKKERPMDEQLHVFKSQLTDSERALIDRFRPDEVKMEHAFRKFWSLKEAFTKARGDGLKFEFNRCSFRYMGAAQDTGGGLGLNADRGSAGQPVALASVVVDGMLAKSWRFYVQGLQDNHFISVARGPPTDVIDAIGTFKASFGEELSREKLLAELARPEPAFVTKVMSDLVPDEDRRRYTELTMKARIAMG